eukprot:TRINITY_DN10329_c0_g1_i1.p1 TRINITY_DN10329_c0_g1~~TRINITY_DN10329_c0_g1_i1.p1  ORF type:complete len:392 (-),score=47.70 TRINITY_DN10329_c0_g1_i1:67-1164(-)
MEEQHNKNTAIADPVPSDDDEPVNKNTDEQPTSVDTQVSDLTKRVLSKSKWDNWEVVVSHDAKTQSYWSYVLAIVTSLLLVGLFYYLLMLLAVCLYYFIAHGSMIAVAVIAAFVASTYYPSVVLWQGFIDLPCWKSMCEYFSFTLIRPKGTISVTDHFLFVEFPHGVFPLGFMLSATAVQTAMKGLRVEGAIASVLFRIPLMRQLCHWFGARPASDRNIKMLLDRGSVGLMAGGIAEIFLSSRKHERVYVKNRRGFVKLALQTGSALVPVYHFGNTQLFDFVGNEGISRRLRTSILLFVGRWYLPIPYQHPIRMVIGTPIEVVRVDNPSKEQIDKLHAQFVAALQELFDEFKGEFGWQDKQLEIF